MITEKIKKLTDYTIAFTMWTMLSAAVGVAGGLVGSIFHICIDGVTEFRAQHTRIVYFLPLAAVLIRWMYHLFKSDVHLDTNLVIRSLREDRKIPLIMIPLIFLGTVITQLFGGSAGREGAALQLGGSIGYNAGRTLKLNNRNMHIMIMSGMSAVFSALFGTPITAAVFSLEVASVGVLEYTALLPCIISSLTAFGISGAFGLKPVRFDGINFGAVSLPVMIRVLIMSVFVAILSIIFCITIEKISHFARKLSPGGYFRAVACSVIVVLLTLAVGTYDYNGAGMLVVERAMRGEAEPFAFILKLIFTALSLSAGFKGGEIVPAFFVGSTFGCVVAPLLGLSPAFGAAIGFVALFCGVVNCPLASLLLSVEVFSCEGIPFFALSCGISYMLSGYFGLYRSQRIVYSKTSNEYVNHEVE